MPQFQEKYPERNASPPVMAGQMPWDSAVLPKLRRSQLVWLAKAFGVQIDVDAPKDRILPILIAAEQQGQFRRTDYDKYCYARAELTPDDPPLGHWRGPSSVEG